MEKTGGAAARIASHSKESYDIRQRIRTIDKHLIQTLEERRQKLHQDHKIYEGKKEEELIYESIPYGSIMQTMIEEITRGDPNM